MSCCDDVIDLEPGSGGLPCINQVLIETEKGDKISFKLAISATLLIWHSGVHHSGLFQFQEKAQKNMAPAPIDPRFVDVAEPRKDTLNLPAPTRKRLEKAGIDLSEGYPYRPSRPLYLDDVYSIRDYYRPHVDPATRADPQKKALFSAAEKVVDLTKHIGTEIIGLQLKDLNNKQRDELGLLIAERSVVFFRDQDITPQQQKELGEWFGEIEVHVRCSFLPSVRILSYYSLKYPRCLVSPVSPLSGLSFRRRKCLPVSVVQEGRPAGIQIWFTSASQLA